MSNFEKLCDFNDPRFGEISIYFSPLDMSKKIFRKIIQVKESDLKREFEKLTEYQCLQNDFTMKMIDLKKNDDGSV